MDLLAFCDGTYADALALVDRTAAEARGGHVKAAAGLLDTLKGYGDQLGTAAQPYVDKLKGYGGQALETAQPHLDTAQSWLGERAKDPAQLAMLGAGAGAGLGLLGSTVYGEPGRRRPAYGALLGGMMGGAAGGGAGLLMNQKIDKVRPSETLAEADKNLVDATANRKGWDKINPFSDKPSDPNAKVPVGAVGNEILNTAGDTLGGMARGIGVPTGVSLGGNILGREFGGWLPKINMSGNPVFEGKSNDGGAAAGVAGSVAAADIVGTMNRHGNPTANDIKAGLRDGKVLLPKGWTSSDLIGRPDLKALSRPGGVGVGANPTWYNPGSWLAAKPGGLPEVIGQPPVPPIPRPGGLPPLPGAPAIDAKDALPSNLIRDLGQQGQASRKWLGASRFAGTPMPRWLAYPGVAAAHYSLARIPGAANDAAAAEHAAWVTQQTAERAARAAKQGPAPAPGP